MAAAGPLASTPYFHFDRRPFREERVAAYIRREHGRGRHLTDVLADPYVRRCGGPSVVWTALRREGLIDALARDACEAIAGCRPDGAAPR